MGLCYTPYCRLTFNAEGLGDRSDWCYNHVYPQRRGTAGNPKTEADCGLTGLRTGARANSVDGAILNALIYFSGCSQWLGNYTTEYSEKPMLSTRKFQELPLPSSPLRQTDP